MRPYLTVAALLLAACLLYEPGRATAASYEPNDSTAMATPLKQGTVYLETIRSSFDVDFFSFTAATDTTVEVGLVPPPGPYGATMDFRAELLDAGGFLLGTTDPAGRLFVNVTRGAQYFVRVYGNGNTSDNPYYLSVVERSGDQYEPNDTTAAAFAVKAGETYAARFSSPNDVDIYRFVPLGDGPLDLYVTSSGSGTAVAQLESSTGMVIAGTDSQGKLTASVAAGSTYYLRMTPYSSADSYSFRLGVLYSDTYEPNNFASEAYPILPGTYISKSWDGYDVDYYSFTTGEYAGELRLTVHGLNGAVHSVELRTAWDSPQEVSLTGEMVKYVNRGTTYLIRINPSGSAGWYSLSFALDYEDTDEPNYNPESAVPLLPNTSYSSKISGGGDEDLFSFVPAESGQLDLRLTSPPGSNYWVKLLNASGNSLASAPDGMINYTVTAGFQYYAEVTGSGSYSLTDPYTIRYTVSGADPFEPNGSVPFARAVEPGTYSGDIESAGDYDYYTFVAPASGRFTLSLISPPGLTYFAELTEVSSGMPLASTDPSGNIAVDLQRGSRYYIGIQGGGASNPTQGYTFTWNLEPADPFEPNDPQSLAVPIQPGVAYRSKISTTIDRDHYRLVPTNAGRASIMLTSPPGASYSVELFDADWRWLAASGPAGTLDYEVIPGLPYYLRVAGNGASSSVESYTLTVSITETDPYEPNDNTATATQSHANTTYTSRISSSGDLDYYSLFPYGYGTLKLEFSSTLASYLLQLQNEYGSTLGSVMPGGTLTYNVDGNVRYYVMIQGGGAFSTSDTYSFTYSLDANEPNDTLGTATAISPDMSYWGTIHQDSDVDYYTLITEGTGEGRVTLTVPAGVNYDLDLLNSAGTVISSATWGGAGQQEMLSYTLSGGVRYYLKVHPANAGNANGDATYTLSFTMDRFEPNNDRTYAPTVSLDSTYSAVIASATDHDYFRFTTPASGRISASLSVPAGKDYDVRLLSSAGSILRDSAVRATGGTETITYEGPASTYYLQVVGLSGYSNAAPYSLNLSFDAYEPNDSTATAPSIALGTAYSSKISTGTDQDYYAVNLPGGRSTVKLTVPAGVNYDVQLLNASGAVVATGNTITPGAGETIATVASSSATYYVRVYGVSGAYSTTSSYSFSVYNDSGEPGDDSMTGARYLYADTTVASTITYSGDIDYYKFYPTPGNPLVVRLTVAPSANYDLQLLSGSGTILASSTVTGNGGTEVITYTPSSYAYLYLKVYSPNGTYSEGSTYSIVWRADSLEPNNSTASPYTVALGSTYSAKIFTSADVDYYRFTTSQSGRANFTLSVPSGVNYDLQLLNSAGTVITGSYNSAYGGAESLWANLSPGATYFVRVAGVWGAYSESAAYSMVLNFDPYEPNDSLGTATTANPGIITAKIYSTADQDYITFVPAVGGTFNFLLLVPAGVDYNLQLLDANGVALGGSYSTVFGGQESLGYALTAGVRYYLRVYTVSGSSMTASYSLEFDRDGSEPNDTASQAILLDADTNLRGRISTSTDVDYLLVTPANPGTHYFSLKMPSDSNYDLQLLDSAGNILASGAATGLGTEEVVGTTLTGGGTYFVKVFRSGGVYHPALDYTLAYGRDSYEPNNTIATATPLAPATTVLSRHPTTSDLDYYAVTPAVNATFRMTLTVPSSVDYDVQLVNAAGATLAGSYLGTGSTDAITYNLTGGVNYYIKVYPCFGTRSVTENYSLVYYLDTFEPNDSQAQATAILPEQNYDSYISTSADTDHYKITPAKDATLRLVLLLPVGKNYEVHLLNGAGAVVGTGTDFNGARLLVSDLVGGTTYYVRIRGVSGAYSLAEAYSFSYKLTDQYESNDTREAATPLTLGQTVSATIHAATDVDYFTLQPTAGAWVTLKLQPPAALNYDLELLDSAGNVLATGATTGSAAELVRFRLVAGTTYYIRVFGATGAYSMDRYSLATSLEPFGTLAGAPGSVAGPGKRLTLTGVAYNAVSWTGLEWKRASDSTWSTEGESGPVAGDAFAARWTVPQAAGVYQVRAALLGPNGEVGYTDVLTLTVPAPVADLKAVRSGAEAVISWIPASESGAAYRIYRSTSPTAVFGDHHRLLTWSAEFATVNGRMEFRDAFIQPQTTGVRYYYWVTIVNSDGIESMAAGPVQLQ